MSNMKFYVDAKGAYLGAWDLAQPELAVEVSEPPQDARQVWDFDDQSWGEAPELIIETMRAAIQAHMDNAAQGYGYDDIKAAVTYADEPAVPKFQAEGRAFRAWRSLVWAHAYGVLDEVQAGHREQPTADELLAELPKLVIE